LQVISDSPSDVQPVLDTVVAHASRLCSARDAQIFRREGEQLRLVAHYGPIPTGPVGEFTMPLSRGTINGRAVLEQRRLQVSDLRAESTEYPEGQAISLKFGHRTVLTVPLLRHGVAIGTLSVRRAEVRPFTDAQARLLQTFADQAVIAIENVRLFTELQTSNRELAAALDTQTATSDILRVISRSQTDVQPVFDAIVASAARLLRGYFGALARLVGDRIELAATTFTTSTEDPAVRAAFPYSVHSEGTHAQAIRQRGPVNVVDAQTEPALSERVRAVARARGYRSVVAVPLLRHDEALGTIAVARREPGGFADDEIALLQTFADQAVIAIENVRLFKDLETRNRDLIEALDRQTATAEILRVISQAQTELQPVFEAIVDHAMRLFRALAASVLQIDGQLVRLAATRGGLPGSEQQLREQSPWPIDTPSPVGFCIAERTIVHIPDIEADRTVDEGIRALGRTRGWRSILAAPIMRDGQPIGAIAIQRAEAGAFSPAEIELLETFADQAVIAIENTRLLGELRARTGQLTRSVEELTALGAVSRALSSTLDLDRVLQTIVTRASQLSGTDACSVFEYDEATEAFHLRATNNLDEEVCHSRPADTHTQRRRRPGSHGSYAPARPGARHRAGGCLSRSPPRHPPPYGDPCSARHPDAPRKRAHRGTHRQQEDAGRVLPGGHRAAHHLRYTVGPRDSECPPLPGDRQQEPTAGSRQPAQVRVPSQHVARAADAFERHHWLLRGPGRTAVW